MFKTVGVFVLTPVDSLDKRKCFINSLHYKHTYSETHDKR